MSLYSLLPQQGLPAKSLLYTFLKQPDLSAKSSFVAQLPYALDKLHTNRGFNEPLLYCGLINVIWIVSFLQLANLPLRYFKCKRRVTDTMPTMYQEPAEKFLSEE